MFVSQLCQIWPAEIVEEENKSETVIIGPTHKNLTNKHMASIFGNNLFFTSISNMSSLNFTLIFFISRPYASEISVNCCYSKHTFTQALNESKGQVSEGINYDFFYFCVFQNALIMLCVMEGGKGFTRSIQTIRINQHFNGKKFVIMARVLFLLQQQFLNQNC